MRLLFGLVFLLGAAAAAASGYLLYRDWGGLHTAVQAFHSLDPLNTDLRSLFVAESNQNLYRMNCLAEGIGVLLGSILAAIALLGLALTRLSKGSGGGG